MADSPDLNPVLKDRVGDDNNEPNPLGKESPHRPIPCNPPTKDMPQLRFITTTNPEQGKDSKMRTIVRSHAARQYHVIRQQAWKDGDAKAQESGSRSSLPPELAPKTAMEPGRQDQQIIQQPKGSLVAAVGPGGTDPFSSCSLEVTPRMNTLIDHFLKVVGPGMNTFVTSASSAQDPMKTVYVPFSLSDPCVFHGLLLLSARSFAVVSSDASYHVTALAHKTECIRLVNEALGVPRKQTSDATIAAVLMLAVEELVLGNVETFSAHMVGLQSMIAIRGGLNKLGLGGILEHLTLSCDRAYQMYTGLVSLFGEPPSLLEAPPVISLPPGFQSILQAPQISTNLAKLIGDARTTTLIKNFTGCELTTRPELVFADHHCAAVAQHIDLISSQSMITDESIAAPPSVLVEECLSHGLLAYRMTMLRSLPPDPLICLDVGNKLKAVLMRTEFLAHWQDHFELLLWIAFMGAHTTMQGPLRDWYALLLGGVSSHMGLKSWEQIISILKRFLWIDRCEILGRVLWLEVEMLAADGSLPIVGHASTAGFLQL